MVTNEQALISEAQNGDREALNILIGNYWQPIYRLVCYKVGNSDDAQELTQETFLRAFRALGRYKDTGASFKTYLGRIALNLVTDFWRKKGRAPQIVDIAEYQEPLPDSAERPEDAAISTEQQQELAKLIGLLPDEQRQTIELRIIAGISVKEAAHIMGKTEPALKMLQQRALKSLRKMCIERGFIEGGVEHGKG
ncbi:ECF RNA polymerase sigma factor SigD [bioreactor metagenome]|uniref:ECF RNA polymerase sigma factor SigD n=1 Tax=bioreactor metagenome TaxID=1076179 RepID=A0A644TMB3_9ZZZZ|nr:RNA polymerase sigma factor [Negativicutes bacterium]